MQIMGDHVRMDKNPEIGSTAAILTYGGHTYCMLLTLSILQNGIGVGVRNIDIR